jgi:hypothetical protein
MRRVPGQPAVVRSPCAADSLPAGPNRDGQRVRCTLQAYIYLTHQSRASTELFRYGVLFVGLGLRFRASPRLGGLKRFAKPQMP